MNKKFIIYIIVTFSLLTAQISAQNEADTVKTLTGIEIITSVDKAEAFIGDLIEYTVTINYDSTYKLIPPPLGANLGGFDVKDYQPDIISELPNGQKQTKSVFVLSTFTTGDYLIPPVPIGFILSDSSKKIMLSETVPIKIKSLIENTSDSTDIKPLKAQYEYKRDLTPYYLWGGVIFVILVVAGYFIWRRFSKKEDSGEPVDLRPAWEIAFEKLALLNQKDYIEENKFKDYYFELTEIARAYLGSMYEVNVLDMTTDEFVEIFKEIQLPENLFKDCKMFLIYADLVKFAKFIPERQRIDSDFQFVHKLVESLRADFERKQSEINIKTKARKTNLETVKDGTDG